MVANLSAIPSAGDPYRLSLLNRTCGADARDESMALFKFGVQTCGMRVKVMHKFSMTSFIISLSPEHEPGTLLDRL